MDQQTSTLFEKTVEIPEEERTQYDRIGIIARSFGYYFDPQDVPENSYRYLNLIMNPAFDPNGLPIYQRGEVIAEIFTNACPAEFITSPGYYFSANYDYDRTQCFGDGVRIDSSSGNFLLTSTTVDFFTNANYANRNRPLNALVNDPMGTKILKFKTSPEIDNLATTDPYILVVDYKTSDSGQNVLQIDLALDKVLFWDSPDTNNTFSPQSDANDRPNATNGTDNLQNSARKNLVFRLPTIKSKLR
ncbi:hypothetical protein JWG45_18905 [Leptospira sp. 201903070]|uniref:Uncharacterized protein n=1 Tax=Leptospira ainlahdjerensis TaxID=2810033 RepID=A0ABS2UHZ2_9LEPT|nr:hypothetical protein [Leptospira ainlahdjerensis]